MNKTTTTFDDTLAQTGNQSSAITRGEQMARERAEDDAPDMYCHYCVETTPLAYDNARDVHTISFIEDVIEAVAEQIEAVGGDLTDVYWIRQEIQDTYVEAYYDACADPEGCEVCNHPDAYDECGHERLGEPCPARTDA